MPVFAREKTPKFAKIWCENTGKNFALIALFCAYREHWFTLFSLKSQNKIASQLADRVCREVLVKESN